MTSQRFTMFLILCVLAVSCKSLPKVTWCSLNGDGTAQCLAPDAEEPHTVQPIDLENYLAISPDDGQKLIEACKKRK